MSGYRIFFVLLPVIAVALAAPVPVSGAMLRVPSQYATIQPAIDAAVEGDTVLIAPGTYRGDGNTNLTLRGPNIVLTSESGPEATVIDCEDRPNTRGLLLFWGHQARSTVIEGLTFCRGTVYGGGILMKFDEEPTVRHCIFRDNHVTPSVYIQDGGALVCEPGDVVFSPLIIDCEFRNNSCPGRGGAAYLIARTEVIGCTFENNAAGWGGAVVLGPGTVVRDCVISGNSALQSGGGIQWSGGEVTISGCEITRNYADESGGGISVATYAPVLQVRISDCTIAANAAGRFGGGIEVALAPVELTRTILRSNCSVDASDAFVFYTTLSMTCCAYDTAQIVFQEGTLAGGLRVEGDPRFCAPAACPTGPDISPDGVWTLRSDSPCLGSFSPCGERIGARDLGCGAPEPVGACCYEDESCRLLTAAECTGSGGVFRGDGESCYPNGCGDTAVERSSWGRIKARFGAR